MLLYSNSFQGCLLTVRSENAQLKETFLPDFFFFFKWNCLLNL